MTARNRETLVAAILSGLLLVASFSVDLGCQRAAAPEPAPTREEVAGRYRDYGIHMMKRQRILDFIATRENIKASQADVDRQIETIAGQYGQPVDKVKEALRRNGTTMRIRDDIRERKTLDYLIGEYDPAAEQAAAPPAAPAAPAEAPAQQQ